MSSDAERPSRGPDGGYGDWRIHELPEVEAWVTNLDGAIQRWGSSYVAWILLRDTDLRAPDLEERFVGSYAGWYPDRRSLTRAQLETLGWNDALASLTTALELPPAAINFNWDRLWTHCLEVYDIEERLGGVHAFMK